MSLKYFFNPAAVAVIGASSNRAKLGRQILDNIIAGGFAGHVYPVNLKEKRIAGRPAYASLTDLPVRHRADYAKLLAVIAIPAPFILDEIKQGAALGVKNFIIISAGFKEDGPEGKEREVALSALAEKHHLNILGPNCLGFINTYCNLNATFAAAGREPGRIAFLSQSGAIGSAALDWLKLKDFNLGYFISLGNKAVLDENDIFAHLMGDDRLDLIVAYLEEIKDGGHFMKLVSRLAKHKPVAILKAGQSAAGSQLALSHTGSLAGSAAATRAGIERAGAIWLNGLEELFNLLMLFRRESWQNKGREDLYVITNAGGVAVLTVDEISRQGLTLGKSWDLLGDADAGRYQAALKKWLPDKKINNILVLLTPQTSTEPVKTAQAIIAASRKYPHKFIIASFLGGQTVYRAKDLLEKANIPIFDYPEEAVESFRKMISYKNSFRHLKIYHSPAVRPARPLRGTDYLRALKLLAQYKINIVPTRKYSAARPPRLRGPLVLKAVGPDFLHKTEKKAVFTDLDSGRKLRQAARQLLADHKRNFRNPKNYLVYQPQITGAQEIILGFTRDESFGPIILVGLGGIYTEIFKEVRLATADLDEKGALNLISGLKNYPILLGARGHKKYDLKALVRALVNLGRLANAHPEIKALDINPLFVGTEDVLAGDVRVIL